MIVVGTAGHIDHGKSSIVKRLTGTDPDRLPEEKARGMTIDLGFAFYHTPAGEHIAFVDVPGHERLVKNMIAGAGGVDIVMLVVAADDGWMPQSQEHFQIVKLLGVHSGLIVINKTDLVDSDWLDLLDQDLTSRLAGSFLATAPRFRVSAQTGDGFDKLKEHLDGVPGAIPARGDRRKARVYIDRSFVRPGIGGVVTGTLRGGSLTLGQNVGIWPSQAVGKIRSLHSENQEIQIAVPGQRTAVAVTGVDKDLLVRGGAITDRIDLAFFTEHPVLALSVDLLAESPFPLEDHRRVQVLVGTSEVDGEVRIYSDQPIRPGGSGVAFFRPDTPLFTLVSDRYILRLPTPMVTLGGGVVLDHRAHLPRRKDVPALGYLEARRAGTLDAYVISELIKLGMAPVDRLLRESAFSPDEIAVTLDSLVKTRRAARFQQWAYHPESSTQAIDQFGRRFSDYLKENPHLKGVSFEQLAQFSPYSSDATRPLVDLLLSTNLLVRSADRYDLAGRGMSLKGLIKEAHDQIMSLLSEQPYAPPSLAALAAPGKNHQHAIKYILESGEGYKCGSEFIFISSAWNEFIGFIRSTLTSKPNMAVTELRERFGLTRKYVIPILEETDRIGLTKRQGDTRVRGDRFESQNPVL